MVEAADQQNSLHSTLLHRSLHDQEKYPDSRPVGSNESVDTKDPGVQVPIETASGTATDQSNDLVEFDGPDDPENPLNWPKRRKWVITMAMGAMTFVVTIASSIYVSFASSFPRPTC